MRKQAAGCGLSILVLDLVLSLALWAYLVLLQCSSCGGLAGVWVFAAVKWAVLHVFTSMLTDGKPAAALHRLVALLCLLTPVLESGRVRMAPPAEPYAGPPPDISRLLLGQASSVLACLVWETGLSVDSKKREEKVKPDARRLLVRMLKYFKADTFYLVVAFGCLILGVFCDSFIPLYQGRVIDMFRGEVLETSFGLAVGQLALVSLGSSLFTGLRGGVFMVTLARLNKRLKRLLFHTLLQQEVNFFEDEKNQPGKLSSRLHSDVDRMGRTVALNANLLVRSSVKGCIMLWVMLSLSWELTLLTCIEMPLLALLQKKYINISQELKEQIQNCQAQNKNLVQQTLSSVHTVRSFRAEQQEASRYQQAQEHLCGVKKRLGVCKAVFLFLRRLVNVGIKILMLVQARSLISSGHLSIGSLVSFFLYQKPMSGNLREIMYCIGDTFSTVGVISKVFSYLDRTPQSKKEGALAPERLEGRIVFQDVSFTYPSKDEPALKSVSMEIQPGKMTALVGPPGSGKTSCVSLLKRLYEPQEGQILLDGEPLHHYRLRYLHQKMALVSQNPVLFSGSLRYNIGYGLSDCSVERVKEAARKINADQLFSGMEDGYDTDVGEGGGVLSQGERQCVAIVRALVREPKVIILDEATSNLDIQKQHEVLPEVLARGRTVLVVAHDLKTVESADHIVYMEDGAVVEEGTHQQLMDRRGKYHRQKEKLFSPGNM